MSYFSELYEIIFLGNLFWHEVFHALFALPFCFLIWTKTKSWSVAVIPLIVAYVLDLDHLFDYWAYYGFGFNLIDFLNIEYFKGPGRAFVPFHAYEWVLILLPISYKKGWNSWTTGLIFGMVAHLIWDTISVSNIFFYSIIYRYFVGFRIFM